MALVKCPECGNAVSTEAPACPSCGYPVAAKMAAQSPTVPNTVLAEVRPSWWNFFWHLVFFWLVIPLLVAWHHRSSVVLRIYPGRIVLERGLFSKSSREFDARDIRSVEIDQGILARMVGIGDLTISTSATVDPEEQIGGIPDPKGVRDLILAQRQGR